MGEKGGGEGKETKRKDEWRVVLFFSKAPPILQPFLGLPGGGGENMTCNKRLSFSFKEKLKVELK